MKRWHPVVAVVPAPPAFPAALPAAKAKLPRLLKLTKNNSP
jgi:hypothetical protein